MPSQKQMIASELKRLIKAEDDLYEFMRYIIPNFIEAPHLHKIATKLMQVAKGECKRLMIITPPRHGKSETTSIQFPAWFLGNNPQEQIIACSYSADLATTFSEATRRIVQSPKYQRLWNYQLEKDTSRKWMISGKENNRPSYIAAGVGGPITGEGASCILIDDPLKNMEEANSQTMRDKIWDWYTSTAYTRLHPGGSIVLIQTRWHHDDLAGRLLKMSQTNPDADQWEVLHLPAIDSQGNALWEERYSLPVLESIRESIGTRTFNALYQGAPSTDEGNLIKREWWRFYDQAPEGITIQSWDTAFKTGQENDYSVCWTLRHTDTGIHAIDMIRGKWEYPSMRKMAIAHYEQHRPDIVLIEDHASGQTLIQDLRVNTNIPIKAIRVDRDKLSRVNAITNLIEGGRVLLPSDASWTPTAIEECASFPSGEHDDIVDALSQGLAHLNRYDIATDTAPTTEGLFSPGRKMQPITGGFQW